MPVHAKRNQKDGHIRYGRPRGPPLRVNAVLIVIPAHAGIQGLLFLYLSFRFIVCLGRPAIRYSRLLWIPACAGMTVVVNSE